MPLDGATGGRSDVGKSIACGVFGNVVGGAVGLHDWGGSGCKSGLEDQVE